MNDFFRLIALLIPKIYLVNPLFPFTAWFFCKQTMIFHTLCCRGALVAKASRPVPQKTRVKSTEFIETGADALERSPLSPLWLRRFSRPADPENFSTLPLRVHFLTAQRAPTLQVRADGRHQFCFTQFESSNPNGTESCSPVLSQNHVRFDSPSRRMRHS